MQTAAILSGISITNMIMLGIMMFVFVRMYARTKTRLTLGMIVFSVLLFLQNTIGAYAYFAMSQLFSPEIFPYLFGVHIAELAGLVIFLKISMD